MEMIKNKLKSDRGKDILVYAVLFILPYIFYFNLLASKGIWAVGDAKVQYIPFYKELGSIISSGNFNGWLDKICLGVPFIESVVSSIFYPLNWLFGLFNLEFIYNKFILLHFSIAGIFTYKYVKEIGYRRSIALLGGILYMFSGAINCRRNHVNILHSIVWLPAILYYYEKMYIKKSFKYIVTFAAFLAILIYSGAMQHYLYVAIIIAIYFFFKLYESNNKKEWIRKNIISIGFSILISLPIVIFMQDTMSGSAKDVISYENFSSYSLPIKNLITFIFPYMFGVHVINEPFNLYNYNYIGGGNLSEFGLYIGVITIIGAVYIIYTQFKKDRNTKMWAIILIMSLVFSMGGYIPLVNKFMFHIPIYNLFRVPARWLFISDFAAIILFIKFINDYINVDEEKKKFKRIYGICYWFILWNIFIMSILNYKNAISMEIVRRINITNSAIYIPLIMMTIYYIYIILVDRCYVDKKIKNPNYIIYLLTVILLLDTWTFSFFHENVLINPEADNELATKIKEINSNNNRVWPILDYNDSLLGGTGVNYNVYNDIKTINGYWGMLPKAQSKILNFDSRGSNLYPQILLNQPQILGKLDTEFIIMNKTNEAWLEVLKQNKENEVIYKRENITLAKNTEQLSMFNEFINIVPNTTYKIRLTTLPTTNGEEGQFIVDLYGNEYDSIYQEAAFMANSEVNNYEFIINSGEFLSNQPIEIRVFSFSGLEIKIKELHVIQMERVTDNYRYEVAYEDSNYIVFKIPNKYLVNKLYFDNNLNIFNEEISVDGNINIEEYRSGFIKADVEVGESTNLIFNESYNKGWSATIDGKEVMPLEVNGLIQGINIDAGKHEIVFKYAPYHLKLNVLVYIVSLLYIICSYIIYRSDYIRND